MPKTRRDGLLLPLLLFSLSFSTPTDAAAAARNLLVVCSPGSPGNTAQARPTMEAFARAAEDAAGWPAGSLGAIYFETAQGGLTQLARDDSALALVPLPFLLKYGRGLDLRPRLQVVQASGATETWSLVAMRGLVSSPASLTGWEVTGSPGYAPEFVRGPVLGGWGALPETTRVTFTSTVLSSLRRAAAGEKVAVLLDGSQAVAVSSLPFGSKLEVVTRSKPLPGTLLCTVGDRLRAAEAEALFKGLLRLPERPGGTEVLKSLRMTRFEPIDGAALESVQRACDAASDPAR